MCGGGADLSVAEMSLSILIRVAEHLRVRLPASPPPGTHVQLDGVRKMPMSFQFVNMPCTMGSSRRGRRCTATAAIKVGVVDLRGRSLGSTPRSPRCETLRKEQHTFEQRHLKRMRFYVSPSIVGYCWPASTLLHGHIALAIPSLLETDPQILEHWGYAVQDHLGKSFQAMDFGLKCERDVTQP